MKEIQKPFYEKQEKRLNQFNNAFLTEDEMAYLEMDFFNFGLNFDSIESIEAEEDNIIGIEFSKRMKKPLEVLLVKSIDGDLLKDNLSKIFDDYDMEISFEVSKKIGNKIKEYLFKITVFKDQQFWEEYVNG
jgi:hypothetical protein